MGKYRVFGPNEMPGAGEGIFRKPETKEERRKRGEEALVESFLEPPGENQEPEETEGERRERMRWN